MRRPILEKQSRVSDFIQAHYYLAEALEAQGKTDEALHEYRSLLQSSPTSQALTPISPESWLKRIGLPKQQRN